MATFEQRGAAWRAKVRVRGANLARTFDTHDEALAWARAQEAKLLAGAKVKDGQAAFLTVADLMRRYSEEVSPGKRGERWEVVRLTMMLRDASFGTALRDYGPEQVANWRDARLKIVSASTVNRELNLLSAVFTTAIKDWRIGLQSNPVRLTSRPKNPLPRKRRVSDDEIALIRAALGWDGATKPDTASQWVAWTHAFAVETAMRRGEIMGMTRRRVHLKAAYVELLDGEEKDRAGQTKTGRGRLVPLSQRARLLLEMAGEGDADAPIVPVTLGTADALFRRAVKASKLDDLHFHDSRREATTRIAPKVRQQSIRYTGYMQDFDLDLFEHLKVVDYGDAEILPEWSQAATVQNILAAQAAVERKVNDALDAGAIPIVIGQNSPPGSYAIAKPIAERSKGQVGVISLDTHWDARDIDHATADPRIAGSGNWKAKLYEFHSNVPMSKLVEIGERGSLEDKHYIRRFLAGGTEFISTWRLRTELGIEGLVTLLDKAYQDTADLYVHFDMDVLGGAGPASGDLLGDLAEPIGMSDYEVIRTSHEIGKRGLTGMSFICIPPGSAVTYRVIVYVITYLMAGLAMRRREGKALMPNR